jgi:hypothetical protein
MIEEAASTAAPQAGPLSSCPAVQQPLAQPPLPPPPPLLPPAADGSSSSSAVAEVPRTYVDVATLVGDDSDAAILAARLAEAEREITSLRVELAVATERAESSRQLAAAKDEIITAARNQTKEWRKLASEVLATSAKTAAAAAAGGSAGAAPTKEKEKKKK